MTYYTVIGDLEIQFQGRGQWVTKTTYYGKTLTGRIYANEIDQMDREMYYHNRHTLAKKIIKLMRADKRNN